jgi:hypothetical protein
MNEEYILASTRLRSIDDLLQSVQESISRRILMPKEKTSAREQSPTSAYHDRISQISLNHRRRSVESNPISPPSMPKARAGTE